MRVLFAADGSRFTKKALAFLVAHEGILTASHELHVLHVQLPLPLSPIRNFLERHPVNFHASWVVGHPAAEIVAAARADKSHLIVMGTHGHGVLGRMLLGSVAQRVVSECNVAVLLVK
jgi:nucleotide-binding universal stress UspA family protein